MLDSFSPQTQTCQWLFSAESKLIAKILTARAQRQKFWHSSLCIRKSTHVLGSDPSRIPVWNTIWKICSESTQSKHLHWWAQGTLEFLPARMRRPWARSLSCKWGRQFSLSRDVTWINKLKTGHVELSRKVCVQCALAQPQASHPASNHFQRLT